MTLIISMSSSRAIKKAPSACKNFCLLNFFATTRISEADISLETTFLIRPSISTIKPGEIDFEVSGSNEVMDLGRNSSKICFRDGGGSVGLFAVAVCALVSEVGFELRFVGF